MVDLNEKVLKHHQTIIQISQNQMNFDNHLSHSMKFIFLANYESKLAAESLIHLLL